MKRTVTVVLWGCEGLAAMLNESKDLRWTNDASRAETGLARRNARDPYRGMQAEQARTRQATSFRRRMANCMREI